MLREEKGSALLLVVFMILLFAMLGVAVLGASLGGAQRSQRSEDNVQSLHLAEKAVNEAIASIYTEFDGEAFDPRQNKLSDHLDLFIQTYNEKRNENMDPSDLQVADSELDAAKRPIYRVDKLTRSGTNTKTENGLRFDEYQITVSAEATVNGARRKLKQDVVLDTFPDFLKYAAGSEGDVILNGSPYIAGALYAGDELLIDDYAPYIYKGVSHTAASQYPFLNGSKHLISRNVLKYKENNMYKSLLKPDTPLLEKFNAIGSDIVIEEKKKFVSINVEQSFIDKLVLSSPSLSSHYNTLLLAAKSSGQELRSLLASGSYASSFAGRLGPPVEPQPSDGSDADTIRYNSELQELEQKLTGLTQSTLISGTVTLGDTLREISFNPGSKARGDWLIINGDLIVEDAADPARINANILVTGDIVLRGKINIDATIFSLGNTEVMDASIRGLADKQMVLISKGEINIYRVDSFEPLGGNEKSLDAFFYTDGRAELYGVGSTFQLSGGFFARMQLTINAVQGDTKPDPTGSTLQFDNQSSSMASAQTNSRFQIQYNPKVFSDQNVGLPRVNKIRVTTGKKWLE
ncbi:hypothetical protein [Paenibacillus nasutitermitis]|uniref:Uncharacterized protein n=1 Tax=Paenibacillus nasutitermitis TaxID=1652958 RepID=A0A917DM79_9BACL|nr:hypothetical protein [Paenibacillus nasutitermitis]GGD47962.1 hypothetical protein GCM10010911_01880 [Paenibacillus nasutitermitis]